MGYPIDDFQQRSLKVILNEGTDLLAMAPTGSGKTAVALLAILQAFARGKRAVYTSPIKALSNQKFAEFKEWFRKKGVKGEDLIKFLFLTHVSSSSYDTCILLLI
jgi:superfamily II RNA helicase